MNTHMLEEICALRNVLRAERDTLANSDGAHNLEYLKRLNTAIGALNALLPEKWRVY